MPLSKNTGIEKKNQILHHKMHLVTPPSQCGSFWCIIKFQLTHSPHLLRRTSGSFKTSKLGSKATVLHLLMEFSHNFSHTQNIRDVTASLTAIPKEHFQGATNSGRTTGASVKVQKSSSLKMTRLCVIHITFTTNYVPISDPSTYLYYTRTIKILGSKIRHLIYIKTN